MDVALASPFQILICMKSDSCSLALGKITKESHFTRQWTQHAGKHGASLGSHKSHRYPCTRSDTWAAPEQQMEMDAPNHQHSMQTGAGTVIHLCTQLQEKQQLADSSQFKENNGGTTCAQLAGWAQRRGAGCRSCCRAWDVPAQPRFSCRKILTWGHA